MKDLRRLIRQFYLLVFDGLAVNLSFYLAFVIRFEGQIVDLSDMIQYVYVYSTMFIYITLVKLVVFIVFKMYSSLWRYASVEEMLQIVLASIFATMATVSFLAAFQMNLPRSIYLLTFIFDTVFVGGIRFSYRIFRRGRQNNWFFKRDRRRVMIVGAGSAAAMLVKEYRENPRAHEYAVVMLDDDPEKLGLSIGGAKVAGKIDQLEFMVKKYRVEEIVIAMPSADRQTMKRVVGLANKTGCKLRTLPSVYDLVDGKITIKEIRDVKIEDLLGRDEVQLDQDEMGEFLSGKRILVTGGGGSIGSELCRQICRFSPRRLVILDIYENNAYELELELRKRYPEQEIAVMIASVRDGRCIDKIFMEEKPQVIFHAAAHKHVPLMEANPKEAVKNNVLGTCNVIQSAIAHGVERLVLISTDKAVNPTNVMGATKRFAEMLVQGFNEQTRTELVAVRFGNVLGSNGSVIPLFKRQIAEGGPLTLTHPKIIRYFMTIPEASQLVLQAGAMAQGGEVFVLDMGEPVKIMDLAENLIRLSGYEPHKDIPIEIVGLRPGEKLYEELLIQSGTTHATRNDQIYIEKPTPIDMDRLRASVGFLRENIHLMSDGEIRGYLNEVVPTYHPTSNAEAEES